jgi:hypothetical protein
LTPYPGQVAMHRALSGSIQVTLEDTYRHGVYLSAGNACIDATVRSYLLDGTLPVRDTTCT